MKIFIHKKKRYPIRVDTRRGKVIVDKRGFIALVGDSFVDRVVEEVFYNNYEESDHV